MQQKVGVQNINIEVRVFLCKEEHDRKVGAKNIDAKVGIVLHKEACDESTTQRKCVGCVTRTKGHYKKCVGHVTRTHGHYRK